MMVMTAMMGLTTQNCSVAWRADITIQEETKQTGKDTGGEEEEEEVQGGGGHWMEWVTTRW